MTARRSSRPVAALVVSALTYLAGGFLSVSQADVTASGLGTTVNQPTAGDFEITGGTRPGGGTNLFHSFGQFSLDTLQRANFLNDSGLATTNILARVTGGNPSSIYGTIDTSAFAGANLFLMNPAGIVFGPTAQLNVDGSFHATTADYIKLGNDGVFYANPTTGDTLTVSPPSAFGFLTANPGSIDINTSAPTGILFQVPYGQTISFVGGTINVGAADGSAPGYVMAPAGRLNLISVASSGEATFDGTGFNVDGFPQLGDINIRGNSMIDAHDVYIRAGRLTMGAPVDPADPSSPVLPGTISPGVFSLFGLGPEANGGEVNINVTGDVIMTADGPEPLLNNPGGIISFAGFADPTNKVPDVTINAGGTVSMSGYTGVQLQRFGSGDPGQVTINAQSVQLEKGASVTLLNFYEGPGGNITINASQELNIAGDGSVGPTGATGLLAQGLFSPLASFGGDPAYTYADSGSITVNAGVLRISGDGIITTTSVALGNSSDININAGDIFLSDRPAHINANSYFGGSSGNINISASGQIQINNGFVIFADSNGTGAGGNVNITAGKSISISGEASGISTQTAPPSPAFFDFFAQTVFGFQDYASLLAAFEPYGLPPNADMFQLLAFLDSFGYTALREPQVAGNGGDISIATPILTVSGNNSAIDSGTGWDGNGGLVTVNAGSVTVSDGGQIRSRSGLYEIGTGNLLVGAGNAGTVDVTATDTISVAGTDSAISTSTLGDGNGGDIFLTANRVNITGGGSVSSDSLGGAGFTGNIAISAGDQIMMNEGSISTRAITSDGGNIDLTAPNIIQLTDSQISTSVESGLGGGGNITIDPQFITLNNSSITANAYGGPGGNILIVAQNYIPSIDSIVEASSAQNVQGTVQINSPDNNIAGSIAQLPQNYVDPSSLLPAPCVARHSGAQSTFVVSGRGGVAVDPDNYLPSFTRGEALPGGAGVAPGVRADVEFRQDERITLAKASWECAP